ncbi:50S ribosomal protein L17 [Chloracidobacterium validum]|uniref:Large ribosomal subunit protein bL17 n=1 Tax=Chloracidobacterium validum TaxID=2821543 RepID=A0ABX8BA00_9BACT|nr:50S ribosomal protein L17 [Chloracidobacterium validum]QUW03496.1 50S ribosomal protein L17 [Chloracidobacterium validum]
MRHLNAHRKLGRTSAHRKSLLRNLATSLVLNEKLVTTLQKAKELRPFVERAVTLGKRGDLHARRLAAGYFHAGNQKWNSNPKRLQTGTQRTAGVAALSKLFDVLSARFSDRKGGYTRILKLGTRRGDGAELAIIEFVGPEDN